MGEWINDWLAARLSEWMDDWLRYRITTVARQLVDKLQISFMDQWIDWLWCSRMSAGIWLSKIMYLHFGALSLPAKLWDLEQPHICAWWKKRLKKIKNKKTSVNIHYSFLTCFLVVLLQCDAAAGSCTEWGWVLLRQGHLWFLWWKMETSVWWCFSCAHCRV